MSTAKLDAQYEAARAYERLFVPALFGQWAVRLADAANTGPGQSVLDVACGTGVLAREMLRRTGPAGHVAGLDPVAAMLTVARELSPSVDWQQGVAESMPFASASFDAVLCQFGLMFMEREGAIREMLRVLKPGGRLVVAVWDAVQHIPAYAAEIDLLERLSGTRAADALRAPFALGDRARLAEPFERGGAASLSIDTREGVARFPSIRVMVEADLRGWLPVMGVNLSEDEIGRILEMAERELAPHVHGDGDSIAFDVSAHIVLAEKPKS